MPGEFRMRGIELCTEQEVLLGCPAGATSDGQGFAFGWFAFTLNPYLTFNILGYGETNQQCFFPMLLICHFCAVFSLSFTLFNPNIFPCPLVRQSKSEIWIASYFYSVLSKGGSFDKCTIRNFQAEKSNLCVTASC